MAALVLHRVATQLSLDAHWLSSHANSLAGTVGMLTGGDVKLAMCTTSTFGQDCALYAGLRDGTLDNADTWVIFKVLPYIAIRGPLLLFIGVMEDAGDDDL